MTTGKLFQDSGLSPSERHNEARMIVGMLKAIRETAVDAGILNQREYEFLTNMRVQFQQYGVRTMVSSKQLFWLRDIKEKAL